jgi:protocatechuate 3,4-dioxygenase alpha subunit
VPGPGGRLQAPHLAIALFARGLLDRLYCRIYFAGEPGNDGDPILERVPAARRRTLIATAIGEARYRFDIHLQGPIETVFFRC